jgi:SPP1 gp7 family putative phage head morphogenesis protein
MPSKPATQTGLNQQLPKRLADKLVRSLKGMATRTQRILLREVVPAIEESDVVAVKVALERIDLMLAEDFSNLKLRELATPIGMTANERHAAAFFSAMGTVLGVRVFGTDLPTAPLDVQDIPRRNTGPGGPTVIMPKVNVGPTVSQGEFVSGIEVFVGKLRDGTTTGIREEIERERSSAADAASLAAVLALLWRKKGSPSDIAFDRRTEAGGPVLVRVPSHLDMVVLDQMSHLNASFSQQRMTSAAILDSVWETRKDRRVRPSHRALQGRRFNIQEGVNGVQPGEPFGCRCWARAVVNPVTSLRDGAWVVIASPSNVATVAA